MAPRHIAAGFGIALVVVAVVAGLFIIGSPAEERARRLDETRLSNLQRIRYAVDAYSKSHARLPGTLAELLQDPATGAVTRDPITRQEYGYRALSERAYQVCADFDRESLPDIDNTFWSHGRGRKCFEIQAPNGAN
jgi:hypothetical protein